jgi:hypothetical protein
LQIGLYGRHKQYSNKNDRVWLFDCFGQHYRYDLFKKLCGCLAAFGQLKIFKARDCIGQNCMGQAKNKHLLFCVKFLRLSGCLKVLPL